MTYDAQLQVSAKFCQLKRPSTNVTKSEKEDFEKVPTAGRKSSRVAETVKSSDGSYGPGSISSLRSSRTIKATLTGEGM